MHPESSPLSVLAMGFADPCQAGAALDVPVDCSLLAAVCGWEGQYGDCRIRFNYSQHMPLKEIGLAFSGATGLK